MKFNDTYKATLTREQFRFYEMRIVSRLLLEGKTDEEIIKEVYENNLFQYPTEKMTNNICRVCLNRIHRLEDKRLVDIIANSSSDCAMQVCLVAIMLQHKLMYEFMTTVIAEKYRIRDYSFSRKDVNDFFTRLQEQNDEVAAWKDSTVKRIKSLLVKILVDTEYLDDNKSEVLNIVLIDFDLKNILLEEKRFDILQVFNCFEGE